MHKSYTLSDLAARIGAQAVGNVDRVITGLGELDNTDPARLCFLQEARLASGLAEGVAVAAESKAFPQGRDGLIVQSFRSAMGALLSLYEPTYVRHPGISRTAFVDSSARIADSASIGPNCTVCSGARIGEGVKLIANVYVGPDAEIGEDSVLEPMVVIQRRTKVGARCLIHSCAVLGADGFGIIPGGASGTNVKIPQIGQVIIGDDVEIGAGTCIDRATMAETSVGSGTKIDNQVQIGHNCRVGKNCIIASQTGIAGSATIGDGVVFGARAGSNGHIKIADGTMVAGLGIVMKNTKPGQVLSGHPAIDHKEDYRFRASLRRVPDMLKRLKALEEKFEERVKDGTPHAY